MRNTNLASRRLYADSFANYLGFHFGRCHCLCKDRGSRGKQQSDRSTNTHGYQKVTLEDVVGGKIIARLSETSGIRGAVCYVPHVQAARRSGVPKHHH